MFLPAEVIETCIFSQCNSTLRYLRNVTPLTLNHVKTLKCMSRLLCSKVPTGTT